MITSSLRLTSSDSLVFQCFVSSSRILSDRFGLTILMPSILLLRGTDVIFAVQCLKFKTDQAQDAKKMEKLNMLFFTLMTKGENGEAHHSVKDTVNSKFSELLSRLLRFGDLSHYKRCSILNVAQSGGNVRFPDSHRTRLLWYFRDVYRPIAIQRRDGSL